MPRSKPPKPGGGAKAVRDRAWPWRRKIYRFSADRPVKPLKAWADVPPGRGIQVHAIYLNPLKNSSSASVRHRYTTVRVIIAPTATHSAVANADVERVREWAKRTDVPAWVIDNTLGRLGLTAPKAGVRRGK